MSREGGRAGAAGSQAAETVVRRAGDTGREGPSPDGDVNS